MSEALEEIAFLPVADGVLEAIHVPYKREGKNWVKNPYAFHQDERVRAAYHFGVLRAARKAAIREGYVV